jgi:FtsP/CotA-like multicopper oxidase with cupredoxin domain
LSQHTHSECNGWVANLTQPPVPVGETFTYEFDAIDAGTFWYHPMHLHGHSFRVILRNGVPTEHREWQDTVLMAPRERVEIALVADNPGDWVFHCHVLEHMVAGMKAVIRVA